MGMRNESLSGQVERRLTLASPQDPLAGPKIHILLVEDDLSVAKLLKTYLGREGYSVSAVSTVAEMRSVIAATAVDLVILDVGLPDEDGWSALKWVRGRSDIPVLMLTDRAETVDKIVGLELGADDYLAKPFDSRELLARIRVVFRRLAKANDSGAAEELLRFAEWSLDPVSQQLRSATGEIIHLTHAEFRILIMLATNLRKVVSRDQLMDVLTGRSWDPLDRSIDVHMSNLRRKLDPDPNQPSLIRTIRGAGYMLVPSRA